LVPYPPEIVEQIGDEPYVRDVLEILYRQAERRPAVPTR
jgi:hypothetical protein